MEPKTYPESKDDQENTPKEKNKTLITPLGFETTPVLSFIGKEGIGKGDKLIVVRPEERPEEKRGERAFNQLKETVENFSIDVEIEKVVLDTQDFTGTILEISNIFKKIEGDIVVNLSGGIRTILVALTACTVFFHSRIERTYNYEMIEREMKPIELPYVFFDLTENEKSILEKTVEEHPISYNDLTDSLDLSKSTVSRLTGILENKELVSCFTVEKQTKVNPTLTGELVALTFQE